MVTATSGSPVESGEFGLESFRQEFGSFVTRYKGILYKEGMSTNEEDAELDELKIKMITLYASKKVPSEMHDQFVESAFSLLQTISEESSRANELTGLYVVEEIFMEMVRARRNKSTGFNINERDDSVSARTQRAVQARLKELGVSE